METLSIPLKLIISLVIGLAVGLERESSSTRNNRKKEDYHAVGIRTFSLVSTLGTISGLLMKDYLPLSLLVTGAFMLMVIAYYVLYSLQTKDTGFTTELSIIFTYLIGLMVALNVLPMQVILALTIVLILILSKKQTVATAIQSIHTKEFNALLGYGLIALVILPFLPNVGYTLGSIPGLKDLVATYGIQLGKLSAVELINPFKLWFVVAIITGVDSVGYILERTVGKKHGRLLASLVGGFISSTATTQSLALESKTAKNVDTLVSSAIFANLISYFSLFILIASVNGHFLVKSTPVIIVIVLTALVVGLFFFFKSSREVDTTSQTVAEESSEKEVFALGPAIQFAIFFLIIKLFSQIALVVFGQGVFFLTIAFASLTGTDAATLNTATLAGSQITYSTAVFALVLISTVNLLAKSFYSYMQGSREFALKFFVSVLVIIVASLIGLVFI